MKGDVRLSSNSTRPEEMRQYWNGQDRREYLVLGVHVRVFVDRIEGVTTRGESGKKDQFVPPLCKGRLGGVEWHTQRRSALTITRGLPTPT